jgi:serine/threonine protein kinase
VKGVRACAVIPDHELLRCVGKGAYGEVWLARSAIGTYHAVKIVYRFDFSTTESYAREFKGIQKYMPISLKHPGLVHILHTGRNDEAGYYYCIMEAGDDELAGQVINPETYSPRNLAKDLRRRGKIPVDECVSMTLTLADALDFLHQQRLIHRDIKPSNVIFVNGVPKLADIGLVTDIGGTTGPVTCVGTEGFIAPEGPGTAAADVYSLGKVMYEASMGRDRERFPELPTSLADRTDAAALLRLNSIILKACEEIVGKRYQAASELRADLLDLQRRFSLPRGAKSLF